MRIGLISDTHSFYDPKIDKHFNDCDEIWHLGDIGTREVISKLEKIATLRAVYGNIDDKEIRAEFPENNIFEIQGIKFLLRHIVGTPNRYSKGIPEFISKIQPDVIVCGHSHICKVCRDDKNNLLYINPGAAGKHGFHKIRTLIKFDIKNGKLENMQAVELGLRAKL